MGRGSQHSPRGGILDPREFYWLWFIAVATYGVGDIVTTIAVVRFAPHVQEGNAVVRAAFTFGEGGFAGLKLVAFLICLAISVWAAANRDRLFYYLPPSVLAVVGMFVTVHNVRLLMG